jgi:hypothetical protein
METTDTGPGRRLGTSRKLLFTSVCLLLGLGALEAGARVRAWLRYGTADEDVFASATVIEQKTGLRIPRPCFELRGRLAHVKINSLGFRGEEITLARPPRTVRIVCLGASTTYCAEASSNDTTWPHLLQIRLAKHSPDVAIQVVNAGVPGYTLADSLKNLEGRALALDPDLVIYYEANNELCSDTKALARARGLVEPGAERGGAFVRLARISLVFDLLYKSFAIQSARRDSKEGKLTELPSDITDHFVAKLGRLDDILRSRGIPLVLSAFQVKYRRDQPRPVQIANADVSFFYMPWLTMDSLLQGMDLYNDAIVRFAHERGIPVVESRDAVPAAPTHFSDCMHFRDAGCEVMAERFASFLEDRKVLEPIVARRRAER